MLQLLCEKRTAQTNNVYYYRSFLTRAYPIMKKNNPHVPILIREGTGVLPRVYARYGTALPASYRHLTE